MVLKFFVIYAVVIFKVTSAVDPWTTTDNLRTLLNDHFGDNRHHVTNPDGKDAAFSFIDDTFKGYGLQVVDADFYTDNPNVNGKNIVGMWPGRLTGTRLDRPIVLTAHYDSSRGKAAVQDNGSGLAALMEAARLITSQPCIQDYLVVFAALDMEIKESPDHNDAACYNGYCGSKDFAEQYMIRYLDSVGVNVANINGVIILDSILNFNDTLGAQTLPPNSTEIPGLKESAESIKQDGFKGNFILVASREEYDFPLYSAFYNRWDSAGQPQYKRQSVLLPLKDVVSAVETQSDPNWNVYREFISDDLTSFWNSSTDIKAMLLTDTMYRRGRGRPNNGVDDKMVLTDERLGFLKKITDVVTRTVMDLAKFKESSFCKDPMTEAPAAFREGLQMSGTLNMPQGGRDLTITVDEFTSSGRMGITVVLDAIGEEHKYTGRFNADDHRVLLWVPEPPLWDLVTCFLSGHLHEVNSGVLFTGEMNGKCGDFWPHDVLTIVASDSAGSCGLTPSASTESLRSILEDHFSENRHHVTNLPGKLAAETYIYDTLKSYGMQIYVDEFDSEYSGYKGKNIVGIWRGTGTPELRPMQDKPVILGAHYDTCRDNLGVDENGSGVAALMEAARVISSLPCLLVHSVVFAFFDLKCSESGADKAACADGQCGSKYFVEQTLVPYLGYLDVKLSDVQGVIIMDSILNYNNSKGSQTAPEGFENTPLWDEMYVQEQADGMRGNFIAIFTRQLYDEPLYSVFHERWDEECDPQYKRRDVLFPYKNIAEEADTSTDPYWNLYQDGSQDLGSFWKASGDIKGLLLSDTGGARHKDVGAHEKLPLTNERLGFLKKITNVVIGTTMDLAGGRERCHPPADARPIENLIPEGFVEGAQLEGTLSLPGGAKDYSFLVKTLTFPTLRVDATLSNSSWSLDVSGHFWPRERVLALRIQVPKWESLSCRMIGPLVESDSGALYSGAIHGSCSGAWPKGHVGFTLQSSIGRKTVGGGVGNGSLVAVGILVGVILTLLVGAAVWYFRKRRPMRGGPSFTPLPVST